MDAKINQIPNGGFLSSWGTGSGAAGDGSDWGNWTGPGGAPGEAGPENTRQTGDLGQTGAFQNAGGSGGGFVNFNSWLYANPDNLTNQFLTGSAGLGTQPGPAPTGQQGSTYHHGVTPPMGGGGNVGPGGPPGGPPGNPTKKPGYLGGGM